MNVNSQVTGSALIKGKYGSALLKDEEKREPGNSILERLVREGGDDVLGLVLRWLKGEEYMEMSLVNKAIRERLMKHGVFAEKVRLKIPTDNISKEQLTFILLMQQKHSACWFNDFQEFSIFLEAMGVTRDNFQTEYRFRHIKRLEIDELSSECSIELNEINWEMLFEDVEVFRCMKMYWKKFPNFPKLKKVYIDYIGNKVVWPKSMINLELIELQEDQLLPKGTELPEKLDFNKLRVVLRKPVIYEYRVKDMEELKKLIISKEEKQDYSISNFFQRELWGRWHWDL